MGKHSKSYSNLLENEFIFNLEIISKKNITNFSKNLRFYKPVLFVKTIKRNILCLIRIVILT